ncbi:glycine cleavage system aminomethyltransferase GcvT [Microbaculum sp. FT89]|uniref:glycine cleavage system aminomethyltransferase GcvT n=1 Tax=Microbaculum sp. FT89 TaxID=3447298 RepID=UPI003F5331FC
MTDDTSSSDLLMTPLNDRHVALDGRMVPFAGYAMPVQYARGIIAEHKWTRENAGLFDVSHMGQAWLVGPDFAATAAALETLVPGDIAGLKPGAIRYTQFLTDEGGIIDDLMVTRPADPALDGRLFLIVNASRKDVDYEHMRAGLPGSVTLEPIEDRALMALQGPKAEYVMARHCGEAVDLAFMTACDATFDGIPCHISRSGYTGEDGFEISVPAGSAGTMWDTFLAASEVEPIGLGARDTLRLEAGLCLYGHDIDETTSPVEAALTWSIGKRRRAEGGFPGYERIRRELADGPLRRRVGIRPDGRAPAREGTEISVGGSAVGKITSGGFGPSVGGPVAMGYVETAHSAVDTEVVLTVRGRAEAARVAAMPFVPHRYKR